MTRTSSGEDPLAFTPWAQSASNGGPFPLGPSVPRPGPVGAQPAASGARSATTSAIRSVAPNMLPYTTATVTGEAARIGRMLPVVTA